MSIPTYKTTRTGAQVSDALRQMNERIPEGWAVGTADGVPVSSESPFWHNNAKYYAEQAGADAAQTAVDAQESAESAQSALESKEAAAESADSAEASAQRAEQIVGGEFLSYGGDQGLSETEKEQARKNAVVGKSNHNLLDNGWFTVNQRRTATPSSPISGYPADRWYGTYSAVTDNGVTIPAQNALDIYQKLEPDLCAALVGKTVTVSTLEQDGTIASFTCVFPAYGSGEGNNYNMGNGIGCFVQNVSGYQRVRFRVSDSRTTPFALRAAKLEIGTYSTLANDTKPDYATELARCIYSKADSADSYANNGFGRSNRNLLDNPFFTVNQSSYTNNSANSDYVADRWFLYGEPTLTVTNSGSGIVLTGSGDARLRHHIDERIFMGLYGEPLTFGIKVNGKVYSFTFNNLTSRPSAQTSICPDTSIYTDAGRIIVSCAWQPSSNAIFLFFRAYAPMTIQAVKLEHGSVSTLANDAPPVYQDELQKCLYYHFRIKETSNYNYFPIGFGGYSNGTNTIRIGFPTPAPFRRASVTASISGSVTAVGNGHEYTVSSITPIDVSSNGILCNVVVSGAPSPFYTYTLMLNNGAYVDFSSNI